MSALPQPPHNAFRFTRQRNASDATGCGDGCAHDTLRVAQVAQAHARSGDDGVQDAQS